MFEGVRRSYILLTLFLMEVIEELGTDRGLQMLQTSVEKQANVIEREMRRAIPDGLDVIEMGVWVYRRFMDDAGAEVLVHSRDDNSVTFRVRRCPFYEALLEVGVDCGYFLGGLCKNLTLPSIQAVLTRFNSQLKLEPRLVRESAEEFCLERVYVGEA